MKKINDNWQIPAGMRDLLPQEASTKRKIINKLLDTIALWGYEEVTTPVLEYYDTLVTSETTGGSDDLYKLIDRDGSILAMRPEMTAPIARLVGSKITGNPPWRLMYGAEVFRYEDIQAGRQREFTQVGVELIGQEGPEADAEILNLVINALKGIGLENFTISLGHTGVLWGILESLPQKEEVRNEVRRLILDKDFVGLNNYYASLGMEEERRENLLGLLTRQLTRQDLREYSQDLPADIKRALLELSEILRLLEYYGYSSCVQIDLSTLRSQTYYTGMVFEVYTKGIGYPIGGGGRYDHLLHHFGKEYPATGFALGVERLLLSLPGNSSKDGMIMVAGNDIGQIIEKATELRKEGKPVIEVLKEITKEQADLWAKEKDMDLIWVQGGK